ncbi:MAG TPA: MarR family transcriptional regulator [Ktedonobacterales bacterium]|jgi:DNA-binding MarR family transcriptional regulator|nr:MarR family transcriptional regulator [Ktedonobacterales bacterium]
MDTSPSYLFGRFTFELDRAADRMLREHMGISYKRALFLLVLHQCGTVTQHELAVALGYSDPAVSMMVLELAKDGYLTTIPSPEHRRKRLVTITPKGNKAVTEGRQLLDSHFDQLMVAAGVDAQHYAELTERLHQALMAKTKQEEACP